MIRSIETTGKTKELAIRAALEQLKLTEDDITYEILELGRSGFLGIGAVPARVRVSYDDGQSEPKPVKTQPVKAPAFGFCLAEPEQGRPHAVPPEAIVHTEFFNVVEAAGAQIRRLRPVHILHGGKAADRFADTGDEHIEFRRVKELVNMLL